MGTEPSLQDEGSSFIEDRSGSTRSPPEWNIGLETIIISLEVRL